MTENKEQGIISKMESELSDIDIAISEKTIEAINVLRDGGATREKVVSLGQFSEADIDKVYGTETGTIPSGGLRASAESTEPSPEDKALFFEMIGRIKENQTKINRIKQEIELLKEEEGKSNKNNNVNVITTIEPEEEKIPETPKNKASMQNKEKILEIEPEEKPGDYEKVLILVRYLIENQKESANVAIQEFLNKYKNLKEKIYSIELGRAHSILEINGSEAVDKGKGRVIFYADVFDPEGVDPVRLKCGSKEEMYRIVKDMNDKALRKIGIKIGDEKMPEDRASEQSTETREIKKGSIEELGREALQKEIEENMRKLLDTEKLKKKEAEIKEFNLESNKDGFTIVSKIKINKTGEMLWPTATIDLKIPLVNSKNGELSLGKCVIDAGMVTKTAKKQIEPSLPILIPGIKTYFESKYKKNIESMKIKDGKLVLQFKE